MLDLELFAGAGGLAIGLQRAGFTGCRLYEIDPAACRTLAVNIASHEPTLDGVVVPGDVREATLGEFRGRVRLLAAGAPCQPFSLGGNHLADRDARNLFPDVLEAVRLTRPQVVLVENVKGLMRPAFRQFLDYVLLQLRYPSFPPVTGETWTAHNARLVRLKASEREYAVAEPFVLNAADYGVAQTRERAFIVAVRAGLPAFQPPPPTYSRSSLVLAQGDGSYWSEHGMRRPKHWIAPRRHSRTSEDSGLLRWRTVRDEIGDLWGAAACEADARFNHWEIGGARSYHGHSGSPYDWPSKTIKAGVHGVPGGENMLLMPNGRVRYFTLREAACLQSFPRHHLFEGRRSSVTRQIGNAVPCLLAEAVGRSIMLVTQTKEDSLER